MREYGFFTDPYCLIFYVVSVLTGNPKVERTALLGFDQYLKLDSGRTFFTLCQQKCAMKAAHKSL